MSEPLRSRLQAQLLEALGGSWPEPPDLQSRCDARLNGDGFTIERVSYLAEPDDRVPALLLIPAGASSQQPAAAICVWHQHAGQWQLGKSEPAGLAGDPMHHTGAALARLGYVLLCPDALGFEDRRASDFSGPDQERFEFLRYVVDGKCLAWKCILDMRRAVDYLASRAEVDPNRIGCYGHSMGATHTWLVGPWEPRLRALVANCCLPTYTGIERERLLHCFANFIPGWAQYGDTPDILTLIAPRPLHLNFGESDPASPIADVRAAVRKIEAAYRTQGAGDRFSYLIDPGVGHVLSAEMWNRTLAFFAKYLGSRDG